MTTFNALQALNQADFRVPQPLATALVKSSVELPRSLAHLEACFDDYGRSLAEHLRTMPHGKTIEHPEAYQSLLETACSGLELHDLLPHFAGVVDR